MHHLWLRHVRPLANRKAYDLLVQNEVGLVSVTGTPRRAEPGRHLGGGHRGRHVRVFRHPDARCSRAAATGRGAAVDVSLFDALAEWMSAPAYYAARQRCAPARTGGAHATIAPYEPFVTRDGVAICLAIQNAREWTRFCADVLGRAELADDDRFRTNPLRVEHREALHGLIADVIGALDADTVTARLDAAGIAWARTQRRRRRSSIIRN